MRSISTLWACGAALVLAGCAAYSTAPANYDGPVGLAGVPDIVDGNTIEILNVAIGLGGIEAPNSDMQCNGRSASEESRVALERLIDRQTVMCRITDTDDLGDFIALCSADGRDLGSTMVTQGWAFAADTPDGSAYRVGEAEARAAGRGLWGMNCNAEPSDQTLSQTE